MDVFNMACGGIWGGAGGMLAGMLARDLKWETPAGTAVQLGRLSRTASFYVIVPTGSEAPKVGGNVSTWDSEWLGCRLELIIPDCLCVSYPESSNLHLNLRRPPPLVPSPVLDILTGPFVFGVSSLSHCRPERWNGVGFAVYLCFPSARTRPRP